MDGAGGRGFLTPLPRHGITQVSIEDEGARRTWHGEEAERRADAWLRRVVQRPSIDGHWHRHLALNITFEDGVEIKFARRHAPVYGSDTGIVWRYALHELHRLIGDASTPSTQRRLMERRYQAWTGRVARPPTYDPFEQPRTKRGTNRTCPCGRRVPVLHAWSGGRRVEILAMHAPIRHARDQPCTYVLAAYLFLDSVLPWPPGEEPREPRLDAVDDFEAWLLAIFASTPPRLGGPLELAGSTCDPLLLQAVRPHPSWDAVAAAHPEWAVACKAAQRTRLVAHRIEGWFFAQDAGGRLHRRSDLDVLWGLPPQCLHLGPREAP